MFVLRDAKFLSFAGTTVTSTITAVTSLTRTCIQTCSSLQLQFTACSLSPRKKKRAIIEDSELTLIADIDATKVKR